MSPPPEREAQSTRQPSATSRCAMPVPTIPLAPATSATGCLDCKKVSDRSANMNGYTILKIN
jgi:hypothetical protein